MPRGWRRFVVDDGIADTQDAAAAARRAGHGLGFAGGHGAHLRQKRPLVVVRGEGVIEENGVAGRPRLFLQGERDQVAEPSPGHRVLVGEKPVVGIESRPRPALGRRRQRRRAQLARQPRRERRREKEPEVGAVAGAGALQSEREAQVAPRLQHRRGVLLPRRLVEIDGEKTAGFVGQQWIEAHDERAALFVRAREVPGDRLVGERHELPVRAARAGDALLVAHAAAPLVEADRLVAAPPRARALEPARENVVAAVEERAEQRHLLFGRGGPGHVGKRKVICRRIHSQSLQRPFPKDNG